MSRRLRILTWHVHGSYLHYLSHVPHDLFLPVKPGRPEGYGGRAANFDWPDSVRDVPADEVREMEFDLILHQSHRNWQVDRHEILSPRQRALPQVVLEHDPPLEHPTEQRHPVDDPAATLVHVTGFNDLMWDPGRTPTRVVEHGVTVPQHVRWTGAKARGLTVVNDLGTRGRRVGADVYRRMAAEVPMDLVGMGSERFGGLGEVPLAELPALAAEYRFFFNPIRYTSLGLAVCEAMMAGLPILGLATTEMSTAVRNGVNGYVDTRLDVLATHAQRLLADPDEAAGLSDGARRMARVRFGIDRFARDWDAVLTEAVARHGTGTQQSQERSVSHA